MRSGAVLDALAEVRSNGYARTLSGWNQGATSIAAPILRLGSAPMGSIGIAGPAERLTDEIVAKCIATLRNCALQIADLVGDDIL